MRKTAIDPQVIRQRLEDAYFTLDIPAEVECHTRTRLHPVSRTGKQFGGACPYDDCSADTDGFMVWRELTSRGCHYHCRVCGRAGDILKLVRDIKGLGFSDACKELGIPNPYLDGEDAFDSLPELQVAQLPKVEKWQLDQLKHLDSLYSRMKLALQRDRPRAYLAERGIPFELAVTEGLGYLPAFDEISQSVPESKALRRWCDRIIFPVQTLDGKTAYCGRSLYMWQPGMDEDEHKRLFKEHEASMKVQYGEDANKHTMKRWLYTYLGGYYNFQAVKESDMPIFVEGPFDVLACKAVGLHNVISMGTTSIDASALPVNVCSAIMALDIDESGSSAAARLTKGLRRKGIDVQICAPAGSKDWSAAYRIHGEQGLAPLVDAMASRIVCDRCGISNRLSSKAFQILDGKQLCYYCAIANGSLVPPDATLPIDSDPTVLLFEDTIEDLSDSSAILPESPRTLLERLRADTLFNMRSGSIYRGDYFSLRGPDNFYERLERDLASVDQSVRDLAYAELQKRLNREN